MNDQRGPDRKWFLDGMPAKITALLEAESDRGAILILSAYLEELLGELIRSACASDMHADKLLDFRRPAGDFDSRILLCSAFSLIHEAEARALHVVRKLRNRAAHFDKKGQGFDVLFNSDQTIDQVRNLAESMNLALSSRDPEVVEDTFIISTRLLATRIMMRAMLATKPEPARSIKEIANEYRAQVKGTDAAERIRIIDEQVRQGNFEVVSQYFKGIAANIRAKSEKVDESNEG